MAIFERSPEEVVGTVRYKFPESQQSDEETDPSVFTSHNAGSSQRQNWVTGPSGHQYTFRGLPGEWSQRLEIKAENAEDYSYFGDPEKERFQVEDAR